MLLPIISLLPSIVTQPLSLQEPSGVATKKAGSDTRSVRTDE
jgi:hypothetical protein